MFNWIKVIVTTFTIILVLLFAVLFSSPVFAAAEVLSTTMTAEEKQRYNIDSEVETESVAASGAKQPRELEQLTQAKALMNNNRLEQANEILKTLLDTHGTNPEVHYTYAMVNGYLAQQASIFTAGKYAQISKNGFIASIEVDPKYVKGYEGLIGFYLNAPAIAGGSTKKAINTAQKLQQISPLHGTLNLFNIAQNEGEDEQLAALASKLEKEFSHSAQAQFALGFYYQGLGEYEAAFRAFKQAVKPTLRASAIDTLQQDERKAVQSAMYQLGRNAVFSEAHIDEGIVAMNQYLQQELENELPSKTWGQYRLSQLYVLNKEDNKAKPLLVELQATLQQPEYKDKELSHLVSKSLKQL